MITSAPRWLAWTTAGILLFGAALTSQVLDQEVKELRRPLTDVVPAQMDRLTSTDLELSQEELRVAGVTSYLMRVYEPVEAEKASAAAPWVSIYVGFYESQTQGKTIHSPKNCMPGAGWEALAARTVEIPTAGQPALVNRYLLVNEGQRVLVLYWYQGRGHVVASEYQAKWELLRDAALRRRSDEALVRIVVPLVDGDEDRAYRLALSTAQRLLPSVGEALPAA